MGKIIPLWGRGVKGKSEAVTSQRRLNLYTEHPPEADKTDFVLYQRPGLVLQNAAIINPSVQSIYGPMVGALPMIYQNQPGVAVIPVNYLWFCRQGGFEMWPSLVARDDSYAPTGAELAPVGALTAFAYNGVRWFAVNGATAWWGSPNTPATILEVSVGAPGSFPWVGATSVCFLAGRFIVNYPSSPGLFAWSQLNAGIASVWDGLSYATAESSPDALICVTAYRGELILFGTQTIEFWAPDDNVVFQAISGSTAPWGLVAQWSVQTLGNSLYFLGNEPGGKPQVCRLTGYQVEVISTPDVETDILNDSIASDLSRVVAVSFSVAGHDFYILNLTQTSWVFDVKERTWCEWQTEGARWCGQFSMVAFNKLLVSDYRNGNLYEIDPNTLSDNGQAIIKEFDSRHIFKDLQRARVAELEILFEQGVGLPSGQGSDPQCSLQVSRDNGHTFGNEMWTTIGAIGQYLTRAAWQRLGVGRDFVFRVRVSDSIKVIAVRAAIRTR